MKEVFKIPKTNVSRHVLDPGLKYKRDYSSYISLESFILDNERNGDDDLPTPPHRRFLRWLKTFFCGAYETLLDPRSNKTIFKQRVGTLSGVVAPVALGQFGTMLFLRTGKILRFRLYAELS